MQSTRLFISIFLSLVTTVILFAFTKDGSNPVSAQGEPKWEIASIFDGQQFINPAVPVAVVRVTSTSDEQKPGAGKQYRISSVIVENRSTKAVSSVTLRWVITPMSDRLTVLQREELEPHKLATLHKALLAGGRQTLQLSHPKIGKMIVDLPNVEAMGSKFAVLVGVSEVLFEDGSTWKEEVTEVKKVGTNSRTPSFVKHDLPALHHCKRWLMPPRLT